MAIPNNKDYTYIWQIRHHVCNNLKSGILAHFKALTYRLKTQLSFNKFIIYCCIHLKLFYLDSMATVGVPCYVFVHRLNAYFKPCASV